MEYLDALNLLAGIVEQARKDLTSHLYEVCMIPYSHHPNYCAKQFLAALDMKVNDHTRLATIEDLALDILEVIE